MSKKIIKKISLILLIALSISFIGINRVEADWYNYDTLKQAKKDGWKVVCSYTGKNSDNKGKYDWNTYILYNGNGLIGDWMVLADSPNDGVRSFTTEYKKSFNKVTSYCKAPFGDAFSSATAKKNLDEFTKCPDYAYMNLGEWNPLKGKVSPGLTEVCFDSGGYCQSDKYGCKSKFKDSKPMNNLDDNTKNYKGNASIKFDVSNYNGEANCEGILGGSKSDLIKWMQKLFNIIKILAPLLVLGFTIFEFAKAVISQDQDALKKAGNLFVKRLIIMVVLFFLPTIINLLLDLIDNTNGTCNIK